MRYGLMIETGGTVAEVTDRVRAVADAGIPAAGMSQIFGYDALTVLAVAGSQVPDVELVTGVVPTYPRHPFMLAAQALTVQAATGGRLTLGIGLSHKLVVEGMWGLSFDRPLRHMREYLEVLLPLLRGEAVNFEGETIQARVGLEIDAPAPDVLVAALGPKMLELTGRVADGTMTWMTGAKTIEAHTMPDITAAAEAAGRRAPRVAVSLPVSVTADVDAARAQANDTFAIYGTLPSYRAMLDREGAAGPGDVAIVGDEDSVAAQLGHFADIGATDFIVAPFGSRDDQARTKALVADLARTGA
ncbi:MAG TPA: TIGR03564 family F420-dependent LLM class oxidoreductase [Acidimicrobiales bacterium]|nr:TIGR03564 family F420-dependent LLM class oxidoreductase [Acidimicrobiales bacterium]